MAIRSQRAGGAISPRLPKATRAMAAAVADQFVSSGTNFLVITSAATASSASQFGRFGVAVVAVQLAIGALRASVIDPTASRFSSSPPLRMRGVQDALAITLAFSAVLGAAFLAMALVLPVDRALLLGLLVALPALLSQEALRTMAFMLERPRVALASDCLALILVVLALFVSGRIVGPAAHLAVWGASAAAASFVAAVALRAYPSWSVPRAWLSECKPAALRYLGEFGSLLVTGHVCLLALGAMHGAYAVGPVKAIQALFGPVNVLSVAAQTVGVPYLAKTSPGRCSRVAIGVSVGVALAAALWAAALLAIPDELGAGLFGATWSSTRELVIPWGVLLVATAALVGPNAMARARNNFRPVLRAGLVAALVGGPFAVVGGAAFGGAGYVLGMGLGYLAGASIAWRSVRLQDDLEMA